MGRHVPPHRWADAEAGRLSSKQLTRAEAHARTCDACATARARVRAAQLAMRDLGEAEPEDMRWDEVGAQIYWSHSKERRAAAPARRPWAYALAAGALAAAGVAAYLLLTPGAPAPAPGAVAHPDRSPHEVPAESKEPAPDPLMGVVTVAGGDVTVDGEPLDFDAIIVAGQTLATADGARATVQFGPDSAFSLGENTTLTIADLDTRRVELAVSGTVDVRVSHRAPDQQFAVVAGDRRVVVRGTVFRVDHRDDALEVVCTEGRVAVVEGDHTTDVNAGQRLRILDVLAASEAARPLRPRELARLEASLQAPMLHVFDDARGALADSARLDVDARGRNAVAVDGISVGRGDVALRVQPGRHHVEVGRRAEWVEVAAGADRAVAVTPKRRPSVRVPQLEKALAARAARMRGCARTLASQGLAEGSFVTFELGVNRDGSQGYLNVIDSNVPRQHERCVFNVVNTIEFPPGPRERIVKKIPFAE